MMPLHHYPKDTIRARLLTMSFVSTAMVVILLLGAILTGGYVLGRSGLLDDLRVQSDMIASQSTAAMMFNDAAAGGETLAALRARSTRRWTSKPMAMTTTFRPCTWMSFARLSRGRSGWAHCTCAPTSNRCT
jgi:Periplasmic sensor domain